MIKPRWSDDPNCLLNLAFLLGLIGGVILVALEMLGIVSP